MSGRVIVRRAARALATLAALAVAAWACLEAAPGHPAERAARVAGLLPAEGERVTPEARREIVVAVASSRAIAPTAGERFARFVTGLARGDLGRSWRDGRPVTAHLAGALPTTLVLILASLLVAYAAGLAGALAAARRPGGAADRAVGAAAALAFAVPPAWTAIVALRTFATGHPWRWFPPGGVEALAGYVLPVACLAYVAVAAVARHGRAALVDAASQPFVQAARARGASVARVLGVHALAASRSLLLALGASLVTYLLGASLVVERAFDLHGLGALLVDEGAVGDAPVVLGATLAAGAIVVAASTAADLVAALADPRLREERT